MSRGAWGAFCVVIMLVMGVVARGSADEAGRVLPQLPRQVTELYLPEEQAASRLGYAIYADLGAALRAKLRARGKCQIPATRLGYTSRAEIASWFGSSRWGCDLPRQTITAEAIARSTLALVQHEGVLDLAVQGQRGGSWRKLTIACTPEKVAWVRDGLPLLPAWIGATWGGGTTPPKPSGAREVTWRWVRGLYRAYSELPPDRLRVLHRKGKLNVGIRDLSAGAREAVASTIDSYRERRNEQEGRPRDYGRSAEARRRRFGVREVVFVYANSHPDCPFAFPFGIGGYQCPQGLKQVFVTANPSYPLPLDEWSIGTDDSGRRNQSLTFLVAMPAEVQRAALDFVRRQDAWLAKWMYEENGRQYVRGGAPPSPQMRVRR